MATKRGAIFFVLRVTIVVLCLYYVLSGLDFAHFAQTFSNYSPNNILITLAVTLLMFLSMGIRIALLAGKNISVRTGFLACVLGFGINNMLPARLGEFAKGLFLSRKGNINAGHAAGIIVAERLLDVNALLLLVFICIGLGTSFTGAPALIIIAPILSLTLIFFVYNPGLRRLALRLIPTARLKNFAEQTFETLQQFATIRGLARPALATVLLWVVDLLQIHLIVTGLAGLDLSALQTMTVFTVITLGAAIPAAPAGLGVFEGAAVVSLGWFGVAKGSALAIALTVRAFNTLLPSLGALLILAFSGIRLSSLRISKNLAEQTPPANPPREDNP